MLILCLIPCVKTWNYSLVGLTNLLTSESEFESNFIKFII